MEINKRLEEILLEMKKEADTFQIGKDIIGDVFDRVKVQKQAGLLYHRKVWVTVAVLLLVCNLTQGILLIHSREKIQQVQKELTKAPVIVVPEQTAVEKAAPVKTPAAVSPYKKPAVEKVSKEEVLASKGMEGLFELYRLIATVSPEIILTEEGENNTPSQQDILKENKKNGGQYDRV